MCDLELGQVVCDTEQGQEWFVTRNWDKWFVIRNRDEWIADMKCKMSLYIYVPYIRLTSEDLKC